ncbi:hypothetical protein GCM10023195_70880 [Actinoallomurus liliacearum]|uniref:2'-5' RNA ligase n=1 Tax=Actinoallomurus liliacearum TaxID=1080073 RepID=A0ABP8TTC4_9ACTN
MSFADLPPGEHAERFHDHWWWRPGWRVGREFFAWHITFDGAGELHRLVAAYQQALKAHGLGGMRFIPSQWLHLTMQGIGFVDEVRADDLERILESARRVLSESEPLTLTFRHAFVADEAIVLPPLEEASVIELRRRLRQAIGSVWGSDNVPEAEDKFRPHASVAYFEEDGTAAPYVAAVESISPQPARLTIKEASLIALNRDHRMYEWRTCATAPLSEA